MPAAAHEGRAFELLVCDTDALIQLFCSEQNSLLRSLKRIYGIQCVITEAVEDELRNPRQRHADCIAPALQRAFANESLLILDRLSLGRFTPHDVHTVYDAIQLKGQEYHALVQRGEAYTHAAAIVLRAAVLSNDSRAIRVLTRAGKQLPVVYLRAYDIVVLFHQRGDLPAKECDAIRKALTNIEDTPHIAFAGCKFVEGLANFYPRLVDSTFVPVGCNSTRELGDERRIDIRTSQTGTL